jgi:hypothetical protein
VKITSVARGSLATGRGLSSPALGFGCVVLFALPFAAVGLGAGVGVVQKLAVGDLRTASFLGLFAVVFGGVGLGLIAVALAGRREAARRAVVETEHPEEPWLWRQDWAAGRIEDAGRKGQYGLWAFAALWNLIALPSAFLALQELHRSGNKLTLIALIFPIIGVGLLVAAARSTIRERKFGLSILELTTQPAVVGHGLGGTVHVASPLLPPGGFLATLSCLNIRTTGSGDNRSTTETIRWQEQQKVTGQRAAAGRDGGLVTAVPVHFRLPGDVAPCDDTNSNDRIVWRLQLTAAVPGLDYSATFDVPVFRTTASAEPLTPEQEKELGPPTESLPYRQPTDSPIRVSQSARGTQIVFPAARDPGAAMGLTGFTALWGAIVWLIIYLKAPIVFGVLFGAVEVILLYATLRMWLRVVEVTASRDGVAVASGFGVAGDASLIPARDISAVEVRIGMQAGSTVYYDLAVVTAGGRRTNAGSGVRDKREAEWLAGLIRQALGK